MQEVIRHWRKSISEPIALVIVVLAAALCMISGPFGTLQSFSAPQRLGYWLPIIISGAGVSLFIRIVLRIYFPTVAKALIETATVAVFTLTFGWALLVWSYSYANWVGGENFLPSNQMQLVYLALVSGSFLWLRTFIIDVIRTKATIENGDETELSPTPQHREPRLMRRLPEEFQTDVLYLAAKDHFVSVHTTAGVYQLRMRFMDAISEMEGVDGHYSHRSFWVSNAAISKAQKTGATWRLMLVNGEEIPVSRKYQSDLEAAGLLRLEAAE